jgi:ribonuclease III
MTKVKPNLAELEGQLNVRFNNILLLEEALTHSSYINQNKYLKHYERLEFLGDSVLQLTISEYLYKTYNEKAEGELTKIRSLIVCENSLHTIAQNLNLGKYLNMSKGEELTGGRERVSILADCVEAIIAAIFLDNGLNAAKKFILDKFKIIINRAMTNEIILDYKTKLQEILQKDGEVSITYNLMKYEGPPHHRKFFTEVVVNNKPISSGSGYSKKESEQAAAKEVLITMEELHE